MFLLSYRWDNAEREHLSPWDLEPISDSRKFLSRQQYSLNKKQSYHPMLSF